MMNTEQNYDELDPDYDDSGFLLEDVHTEKAVEVILAIFGVIVIIVVVGTLIHWRSKFEEIDWIAMCPVAIGGITSGLLLIGLAKLIKQIRLIHLIMKNDKEKK